MYQCTECDIKFSRKDNIRRHIVNGHELDRSYFSLPPRKSPPPPPLPSPPPPLRYHPTGSAAAAAAKIEGCFTASVHLNGDWTHI